MHTTRATSVLCVCGWALAPRTAHPRVGSALGSFTCGQCSAVSGCATHYHTFGAATEPQRTPYVRAERARVYRTAYYIPHTQTRGFHTEGRRSRASDPCIPACASQCVVGPHTDNPNSRHDGHERDVQAGWGRGGRTVRGDCPRSRGRRMGVILHQF